MKVIMCDNIAEFCGTHYVGEDGEATPVWVPDVLRCLKNWGMPCTPGVRQDFVAGKVEKIVSSKVAACRSRALVFFFFFFGILPQLAKEFIKTAQNDAKVNSLEELGRKIGFKDAEYQELLRCHVQRDQVVPATVVEAVDKQNIGLIVDDMKLRTNPFESGHGRWKQKTHEWPEG